MKTNRLLPIVLLLIVASVAAAQHTESMPARSNGVQCRWDIDTTCLSSIQPYVLTDSAGVVQYCWRFAADSTLWSVHVPEFAVVTRYRQRAHERVPDTRPLAMIAASAAMGGKAEPANDPIIHGRAGIIREMSAIEMHLFAYEAGRFDMLDHPTEFHAFILRKSSPAGDSVTIYFMAGSELFPPKPRLSIAAIERDTANGWRLWGHLHDHTFDFTPNKGWLAVTAPSSSDVQYYQALKERFGLAYAFVTNGFNTIEIRADELDVLEGK
jgi:hypothetical protein